MAIDFSSGGSSELLPRKEVNWPPPSYMFLASPRGPEGRGQPSMCFKLKAPIFYKSLFGFLSCQCIFKKRLQGENMAGPINVYFVCGGKYHDTDFVRLEMLKLFAENQRFRVKVGEDYAKIDEIVESDILVTYTIDVVPTDQETEKLEGWLKSGHKWFALHATNSILQFGEKGVECPRVAQKFMFMLGSQFTGHPPIDYYEVKAETGKESHPLIKGIDPMLVEDELYVSEFFDDVDVLLKTKWGATAPVSLKHLLKSGITQLCTCVNLAMVRSYS